MCNQFPHINNQAQASQQQQLACGRALNINLAQAQNENDVVNGMFLVNGIYASILFDNGAGKSFVSLDFEHLLAHTRSKLTKSFNVEVVDGKLIVCNSIIHDCYLNLNDHKFSIDLTPMQLGCFDIIVGMDWLAKNRAEVAYFKKFIRIPLPSGDIL
ncbi:uncharacterized protein LOC143568545 [Bidens hawaiensis]|uniref:uncharacterized protein LOC143568545 n=1 Tax=Bidens hawaiensis TaxID=980011 RepID=UPI00404B4F14